MVDVTQMRTWAVVVGLPKSTQGSSARHSKAGFS
jgi:hypothetical protein